MTGRATFVQAPMVPERLLFRLFSLIILAGAVTGAWFGLVKPYIDRTADRAVADRTPEPPATTVPGQVIVITATTTPQVVAPTSVPAESLATNFSANLPTNAAVGEKQTNAYTVPADSTLDLTDILIQNTFGDQGVVRMRVGNIPFAWNLVNLDGFDGGRQFVTPIRLQPGETVTVEVTCSEVGQEGAATCGPIVVIGGVLRPVTGTAASTTTTEG